MLSVKSVEFIKSVEFVESVEGVKSFKGVKKVGSVERSQDPREQHQVREKAGGVIALLPRALEVFASAHVRPGY